MAVESAWLRHPDYQIVISPLGATAQVWHGDLLLAESDAAVVVAEQQHVDRLYFPESDVRWELFTPTEHHTICPYKGEADYWSLTAADPVEENVVWAYRQPFDQVAEIRGRVAFYDDRVRIVVDDPPDRGN